MQRKVLTCHPYDQTKAHAREGHPLVCVCELSTECLCFPFSYSCVRQKGGPAVCGANEPITDSLSENESEETEKIQIQEKSGDFSEIHQFQVSLACK